MTNETLQTIRSRRSCRAYEPRQITDAELDAVLEAGCSSSSIFCCASTRPVSASIMQYARVLASAGPAAAAPGTSTVPIKSSTVHSAAVNFFIWYTPLVSFMPVRHHLEYTTFFPR